MDLFALSKEDYKRYLNALNVLIPHFPGIEEAPLRLALERVPGLEEQMIKEDPFVLSPIILGTLSNEIAFIEVLARRRIDDFYSDVVPYADLYDGFYRASSKALGFYQYYVKIDKDSWNALHLKASKDRKHALDIYTEAFGEEFKELYGRILKVTLP